MTNENTLQPTNNEGVDVAASEQTEERILDKKVSRRAMLVGSGALAMTGALAKVTGVVGSDATKANAAGGWADVEFTMAGTDGWAYLAGAPQQPFFPDTFAPDGFNTYIFGLRDLTGLNEKQVLQQKGNAQFSAPILGFRVGQKIELTLYNLGLVQRPDLVDSHTFHWHGFRNAIPLYDGTPDTSLSVPVGRHLKYRFQPHEAGTYMYHCHFEDVEHVQMGMIGIVYVLPQFAPFRKCAYEDIRTRFDRQFSIMLTEVDSHIHWNDAHIQVSDFTDYTPDHWTMNGRSYPDTLAAHGDRDPVSKDMVTGPAISNSAGSLDHSPVSSLIEVNAGDQVLLRLASLGFQEHSLVAPGIDMKIVGQDARCVLDVNGFGDRSTFTNTVSIGSGESRDVIFKAPAYVGPAAYDVYRLFDRNFSQAGNASSTGDGGMMTEIRVYPAGHFGTQAKLRGERQ